jgi:hypothetical protein
VIVSSKNAIRTIEVQLPRMETAMSPETRLFVGTSSPGRILLLQSVDHWEFQDLLVCYGLTVNLTAC